MPPKPQINSYALFIREVGRDVVQRQLGRPVGTAEAYSLCSELWNQVSEEQKNQWKARAKNYRQTPEWAEEKEAAKERMLSKKARQAPKHGKVGKPSATARKSSQMEVEEEDKRPLLYYGADDFELFDKKRERDRISLRQDLEWRAPAGAPDKRRQWLTDMEFVMLAAVPYFESDNHDFVPAELAMVTFSLAEGIQSQNIHKWNIAHDGFDDYEEADYCQALERSENKQTGHGIPVDQEDEEVVNGVNLRNDYAKIMSTISAQTKTSKKVFVFSRDYNTVAGCLCWLKSKQLDQTGRVSTTLVEEKLACIEDLLVVLIEMEKVSINPDSLPEECDPNRWSSYHLHPFTVCSFHHRIKRSNCALARAKKPLYTVFETLEELYYLEDIHCQAFIPNLVSGSSGDSLIAIGRPPEEDDDEEDVTSGPHKLSLSDFFTPSFNTQPQPAAAAANGMVIPLARAPYEVDDEFEDEDEDDEEEEEEAPPTRPAPTRQSPARAAQTANLLSFGSGRAPVSQPPRGTSYAAHPSKAAVKDEWEFPDEVQGGAPKKDNVADLMSFNYGPRRSPDRRGSGSELESTSNTWKSFGQPEKQNVFETGRQNVRKLPKTQPIVPPAQIGSPRQPPVSIPEPVVNQRPNQPEPVVNQRPNQPEPVVNQRPSQPEPVVNQRPSQPEKKKPIITNSMMSRIQRAKGGTKFGQPPPIMDPVSSPPGLPRPLPVHRTVGDASSAFKQPAQKENDLNVRLKDMDLGTRNGGAAPFSQPRQPPPGLRGMGRGMDPFGK